MAKVTVTGNAWDAGLAPIPAVNEPELWFRPLASSLTNGLITDREVPADTFNITSGAFSVGLESDLSLDYMPILRWLKNPEDPGNRARSQVEWHAFNPGAGGNISDLSPLARLGAMWIDPEPPPAIAKGVRWLDTNPASADYGLIKKWV